MPPCVCFPGNTHLDWNAAKSAKESTDMHATTVNFFVPMIDVFVLLLASLQGAHLFSEAGLRLSGRADAKEVSDARRTSCETS